MSAPASTHRAKDREVAIIFRLSRADREVLRERARDSGLSVQLLLERDLLGYEPHERRPGPRTTTQESLPMTG